MLKLKQFFRVAIAPILLWMSGCTGYPRILSFPFDGAGRSLNSRSADTHPQIVAPYIVFISERNGSADVYLYDANTRRLIDLPGLNALDEIASHPSITEDGRTIVYAGSRKGKADIYLFNRDTLQKRNLTENIAAEVRNPEISADGSRIAYQIARSGQWDVRICDRQGNAVPIAGNAP